MNNGVFFLDKKCEILFNFKNSDFISFFKNGDIWTRDVNGERTIDRKNV